MVVQHNLTAMNSNRMLNVTSKAQSKSTEKLSSGFKINRAADDAAGLSISEKMRKQIRGLSQASANAQDGISAVQTAEGALNEVQDMLQRMNELAVKAANGTNSSDDRSYIQNEVKQLETEIDRVAQTTKFNETYLLKGGSGTDYTFKAASGVTAVAGAVTITGVVTGITSWDANATADDKNKLMATLKSSGVSVSQDASNAITAVKVSGYDVDTAGNVKDANGKAIGKLAVAAGAGDAAKTTTAKATGYTTAVDATGAKFYDKNGNKIANNALDNYFSTTDGSTITADSSKKLYDVAGNEFNSGAANTTYISASAIAGKLTLSLHVGADATSNNQISVGIASMSAESIGVKDLDVSGDDDTNALDAIETIKAAIQKISTQRSSLGAVQNRLDHTINNLDNVVENTTSAESSIRDTDMASEMVKYSNNNILAQAGQAMLAQANQTNQGVLSLIG